ncbi:hypothetical protein EWM64_g5754 [Hericium alpestre]|uniref:Aminoglycoside phosphotransferase domain-containing protein n=1 Tax=Hericium alpestre TaxID=135208 RepID=A0A4Y9ZXQ7_9AGAM|nr:hypothetical protein EWM64_g5754 [Hericium alpestre]
MAVYQWRVFEKDGTITTVDVEPSDMPIIKIPGDPAELEELGFDLLNICKVADQFCGGLKITEAQMISVGGYHDIYELRTDSGDSKVSLIARPFLAPLLDEWGQENCSGMLLSEVAVMTLLRHTSTIPVPRCLSHSVSDGGNPWILLEKCSGVASECMRSAVSKEAKIRMLHEFADISVQISRVPVPSSAPIGSLQSFDTTMGSVQVGPLYAAGLVGGAGPFPTYQSYISYLVKRAEEIMGGETCKELQVIVALAERLAPSEDDRMWRPTLMHGDLDPKNILSSNGHIDAILDWEFHAVVPAFLALDYPKWLVNEGITDRRFAPMCLDGMTCTRSWVETEEDAAEYRRIFAQSVSALDPDYMRIVEAGSNARRLVDWLLQWSQYEPYHTGFAAWRAYIEGSEGV